jgi:hypothetical protein
VIGTFGIVGTGTFAVFGAFIALSFGMGGIVKVSFGIGGIVKLSFGMGGIVKVWMGLRGKGRRADES